MIYGPSGTGKSFLALDYALQIAHFAARVRGEFVPPVTTPGQALNSMRIVEAECLSARSGDTVQIA